MLYTTISMSLKLREKDQVLLSFESLMDDDSIVNDELSLLASNIKNEVINVLDSFLSFYRFMIRRKPII
jgi:sensor histidine kinase YesM